MRSSRRRNFNDSGEINMTPLIDMVFILLIFFMVTSTFTKDRALKIDRPQAQSGSKPSSGTMIVAVESNGECRVDGQPTSLSSLASAVQQKLKQSPQSPILVIADQRLSSGRLIRIVDTCKASGAQQVAVATRNP